jgi:putative two-component system response regulator
MGNPTNLEPVNRGKVLVVDDEPQNRKLLARLLTNEGYVVHSADDSAMALTSLERHPPDVVLLDVQMPGIDGFELCRRVKQDPRTRLMPVVLVTALGAREHRIAGINAGADDFICKPFDAEELTARVRSLLRLKQYTDDLDSAESIILSLGHTIEARDAYTQGHCDRLARYALALGATLGLSSVEMAALSRGASLHDIGKVGIPDAVLLKTAALTADEYELMKQHTVIGDRLCGTLRSLTLVRPIVRHHHERLDGSGYPDGLRGDAISLLAQIVSIVDTYDAITTSRPYHPARTPEQAYAELADEAARGWRRPDLVAAFIALGRSGGINLAPPEASFSERSA